MSFGQNGQSWLAAYSLCSIDFCNSHNINLHHLGVLYSTNSWDPITEDTVLRALHLLVQPSTYPALVMCNLGRHRTGTVIGCLRKLQKWCLSAILEEYRRYAGQKVRVMNEQVRRAFLEVISLIPASNSLLSCLMRNLSLGERVG